MTRGQYLAEIARRYLGVHEVGGDNRGPEVEEFQACLGGKPHGEAWCMAFVQFCVKKAERELLLMSDLHESESCLAVWNSTTTKARIARPEPGAVVIWQRSGTVLGHCGIVSEVGQNGVYRTIEGNTSPGARLDRNGDGVYLKSHLVSPLSGSPFVRLGFLRPFEEKRD